MDRQNAALVKWSGAATTLVCVFLVAALYGLAAGVFTALGAGGMLLFMAGQEALEQIDAEPAHHDSLHDAL